MTDIHVAPCGCELHIRIRELEAELARWKGSALEVVLARAEKAEAERDEWRMKWAQEEALGAKDRARVAELEDALRMASLAWERKLEAREREEC